MASLPCQDDATGEVGTTEQQVEAEEQQSTLSCVGAGSL